MTDKEIKAMQAAAQGNWEISAGPVPAGHAPITAERLRRLLLERERLLAALRLTCALVDTLPAGEPIEGREAIAFAESPLGG